MPMLLDHSQIMPTGWTTGEWHALIAALTRRRLIGSGLALGLLTACGGSPPTATVPATPSTRAIETPKGTVNVPTRPSRVVVFDRRGTLAYLLDLGIKPLAAMSAPSIYGGKDFHPLVAADAAGVTAISSTEPDLEQVAGLKPDLIVGFTGDGLDKVYDKLAAIAPTVAVAIDFNNPEEELCVLGQVFGVADKAGALIQGFKDDVAKTKATIRNPGRVSIVLATADGARVYGANNLVGQIVTGLGGTITPDVQALGPDPSGYFATISTERLAAIDGDTLVMLANLAPELRATHEKLLQQPLFQGLPAVKAGRVIEVETQAVFGTAGLRGQRDILATLAKAFA